MIAINGFDDVIASDDEVPVLPPCGSVQMLPPMLPPSATFGADDSDSDDSLLAAASKSTGLLPSGVGGMKNLSNIVMMVMMVCHHVAVSPLFLV